MKPETKEWLKDIALKIGIIGGVALLFTIGLNFYIDALCKIYETPVMEEYTPTVSTASVVPVQPRVSVETIEIPTIEIKPVYEGVTLSDDVYDYLHAQCGVYGVDEALAVAVIKSESDGLWVYGDWSEDLQRYRSVGYFQIRDVNWAWLYGEHQINAETPYGNIDAGLYILSDLMYKSGDNMDLALMMYKCGESRGRELYSEGIVLDCVTEVINDYKAYKEANNDTLRID